MAHNSRPSDADILERAATFALEALQAADVQLQRAHQKPSAQPGGAFQWWIDLQFFIVALRRLRRAAELASLADPYREGLEHAIASFDDAVPAVRLLRDVGEHIDDYAVGVGRNNSVGWSQLQVGKWERGIVYWLDIELDTDLALESARKLVAAIERARADAAQKRDD